MFGARVGTQLRVLGSLGRLRAQSGIESSFVILDLAWLVRLVATEFLLSGAVHRIFIVAFLVFRLRVLASCSLFLCSAANHQFESAGCSKAQSNEF